MQRYFIRDANWTNNKITITGDQAHHIVRVMRYQENDRIICNQTNGKAALCSLTQVAPNCVEAEIIEWIDETVELPIEVTIVQGIPKGNKFDFVLQKGTELGATSFIPFKAERSISVWDKKKIEKRMGRFNKIVEEAAEQSQRNRLPTVKQPMSLHEIITESKHYDVKIFAYEEEAKNEYAYTLSHVIKQLKPNDKLLACIGPEGGFSEQEVTLLKENGFTSVRLGPRILRTETAPLYVLTSLSYHFEEARC